MDSSKYPHNCPACNSASYNDPIWGRIFCTNPSCKYFDKSIVEEEKENSGLIPWGNITDYKIYYIQTYCYTTTSITVDTDYKNPENKL